MADQPPRVEDARLKFLEVSEGFRVNNSLTYLSSVESLECALQFIGTPEALTFLGDHLHKMIHTLLRQNPGSVKIGMVEHKLIKQSLALAMDILLKIPVSILYGHHLNSLAMLLDKSQMYYLGGTSGWGVATPGHMKTRDEQLKKFASRDGFQLLLAAPKNAETEQSILWVAGKPEIFRSLLSAVADYGHKGLDGAFKSAFAEMAMALIMSLSEDQLKNAIAATTPNQPPPLQSTLRALRHLCASLPDHPGSVDMFYKFWMDHTNKLLHLPPLVIKLFAWEQMQELLLEAFNSEPHVAGYVVSGAGLDYVNGTYMNYGRNKDQTSLLYIKTEPGDDQKEGSISASAPPPQQQPLLLFRCRMKSGQHLWFFSFADKLNPGTEKDIDAYQHRCISSPQYAGLEYTRAPPLEGWELCPGAKAKVSQTLSMPQLTPMGKIFEAGVTEEMTLPSRLVKWSLDRKLIEQAFGSSIHRAIVGNCKGLLDFLARRDAISLEDLAVIWKSGLSEDADTADEVLTLLAHVALKLDSEKFGQLMDLIYSDVEGPGALRVLVFLEKFNPLPHQGLPANSEKFLHLLWAVYQSKSFPTLALKNPLAVESLKQLLSPCMCQEAGKSFAIQRIAECVDAIEQECREEGEEGEARSPQEDEGGKEAKPRPLRKTPGKQKNILQLLDFLTSLPVMHSIIDNLQGLNLPDKLVAEVGRFVQANRQAETHGENNSEKYRGEISLRLKVIRQYFAFGIGEISQAMLSALWTLFQAQPLELDAFFHFLTVPVRVVSMHSQNRDGMASSREHIFVSYICSPEVDWSKVTSSAGFACFYTHFLELNLLPSRIGSQQLQKNVQLQELGLRTLWNIFRTIPDAEFPPEIVQLLLKTHDCESSTSVPLSAHHPPPPPDSCLPARELLPIVLEILASAASSSSSSSSTAVVRCADLLRSAITVSAPMTAASHAVRGVRGRINVTVSYRTSLVQLPTSGRVVNYTRGVEGTTSIEVHPMETVRSFKEKIAAALKREDVTQIHFTDASLRDCHDSCPLQLLSIDVSESSYDAGFISEGTVVDCTYLQSSAYGGGGDKNMLSKLLANSTSTIGDVLASNKPHFNTLLSICDASPQTSKKIWDLIMLAPTQVDCEREVRAAMEGASGEKCWEPLLGGPDAMVAYNLQIVDSILQPAPEHHGPVSELSKAFISSGGLSHLLQVLITSTSASSSSESVSKKYQFEAALHILRLLLAREGEGAMTEISRINVGLLVEKLLAIASKAAVSGSGAGYGAGDQSQDGVVEDALSIINDLVRDQAVASQLIQHPQSKDLLITVLKSQSKKVRSLSAEFAVQVGRRQPLVFSWLLADLGSYTITSSPENNSKNLSSETFFALNTLLQHFCCEAEDHLDFQGLAALLSEKMLSPRDSRDPDQVLHGYLDMLNTLVACRPACVFSTRLGENFVGNFFENFLFSMEETSEPVSPLLRRAVYNVLGSFLSVASSGAFGEVVMEISKLSDIVSGVLKGNWLSSVQGEVKKPDIAFSGLKNQGCTCYMNSCLQQLFMCKPFREAVLATPLSETQRTSIFHRSNEELVGMDLQMQFAPSSTIMTARASAAAPPQENWCSIKVISYDPKTKKHKGVFLNGSTVELNFRVKGLRLRMARPEGHEPVNPSQEAAFRVVEQLQRTFCFMASSKKRFFDPLPLVEACKTLNLNFNVFQQNDASEFYDKLLDRIEMSTKAPGENVWASLFEKNVFGGRTLYQKIPLECERFAGNKDECGHWQGTRTESFLRVELQISNHDNINDSLAEFFKTELMDGDNKIKCDVCNEAKATNRRACLGALPNTMVLHLKRFDMDYSTFETVKLNNKMEFPLRINMLKYTREGVEMQEEGTAGGGQTGRTGSKEEGIHYARDDENAGNAPNPCDYEYELQGVLIHAGVAGGGHYYSYARDPDNTERWYRLDDDDVTSFNFSPESIVYNCFGGTHHRENGVEENRTANALMLFYSKIVAGGKETTGDAAAGGGQEVTEGRNADVEEEAAEVEVATMSADQAAATPRMITGREAYYHEVEESNTEHTLLRYMLDPDLHAFVRNAIQARAKGNSSTLVEVLASLKVESVAGVPAVAEESVQFGVNFFLSVVLHCRDKSEKDWIACLGSAFVANPQAALWFIQQLTSPSPSQSWLSEYIEKCQDPRAKTAFIQLVVAAAAALSPADPDCLLPCIHPDASSPPPASPAGALAAFLVAIQERIFAIPASFSKSSGADDLFVLIRELANSSACLRRALLEMQTISVLSYFLLNGYDTGKSNIPISPSIMSRFSEPAAAAVPKNKFKGLDYDSLINSVLEAIAAILNVPQMRKAPLLVEALVPKGDWGTEELSPEARDAFQLIFEVYAIKGIMGEKEFAAYMSKSHQKEMTPLQCRITYERCASPAANGGTQWIYLSGFLSYQADRIWLYGDKMAWADLHLHGFRNDLKCSSDTEVSASGEVSDQISSQTPIPDSCIKCFQSADLYRNAMTYHRQTITKGILRKICANNAELSTSLIAQACERIGGLCNEFPNDPRSNSWAAFVQMIVLVPGPDALTVQKVREALVGASGYVNMLSVLWRENRPAGLRLLEFVTQMWQVEELMSPMELVEAEGVGNVKPVMTMVRETLASREIIRGLPHHVLVLEGTGYRALDGEYCWQSGDDRDSGSPDGWFAKRRSHDLGGGKTAVIQLEHNKWFISIISMQTQEDNNLFSAPASTDNTMQSKWYPPQSGWIPSWDSAIPTNPRVTIHSTRDIGAAGISPFAAVGEDSSDDGIDTSSNQAEGDDDMDMYDDTEWS